MAPYVNAGLPAMYSDIVIENVDLYGSVHTHTVSSYVDRCNMLHKSSMFACCVALPVMVHCRMATTPFTLCMAPAHVDVTIHARACLQNVLTYGAVCSVNRALDCC